MTTEIETGLLPRTREALKQIDYSALDISTVEQALDDFVRANFREQQDFVQSTGYKIVQRMIAYVTDLLSYRADYLANNNYLPTVTNLRALDNLLALIGYRRSGPQQAVANIAMIPQTVVGTTTDNRVIRIPPRTRITGTGALGQPTSFEIFASDSDFFSDIVIPSGSASHIAFGIQGESKTVRLRATGERFQEVILPDVGVVIDSVRVNVGTFDEALAGSGTLYNPNIPEWERVSFLVIFGKEDVFEARQRSDGLVSVVFGDGNFGNRPVSGEDIIVNYRVGGSDNGNVLVQALNFSGSFSIFQNGLRTPETVQVQMFNSQQASGGRGEESLEEAKFIAPLIHQAQGRAVKDIDYTAFALAHPKIAKAIAVSRQQIVIDSFEDPLTWEFPLAETQTYTLAFDVHRLDTRATIPYQANFNIPSTSYSSVDQLIVDLNAQLGWVYNAQTLSFEEAEAGQAFIARFDKSAEGFLELWINTNNYQARVTLRESGNSVLPVVRVPYGGYGRVDANYVDIYVLSFAENGNVVTPNAALVNELRTYFEEFKEIQTEVVIRRGFLQSVDISANVFIERTADPQRIVTELDAKTREIFSTEVRELGEALYVSKVYEAYESIEGVAYVDQFTPAQNVVPNDFTLLQLGNVEVPIFEARR